MIVSVREIELIVWPLENTNQEGQSEGTEQARYEKNGVGSLSERRLKLKDEVCLDAMLMAHTLAHEAVVWWRQCHHSLQDKKESQEHCCQEEIIR